MTEAAIFDREGTVIWDLDGTMLDSFGVHEEILTEVLPRQGLAVPPREVLRKNYHGILDDAIDNALGGVKLQTLKQIMEDYLEFQNDLYVDLKGHLFDDAVGLAGKLHHAGKKQYVVTNRCHVGRLNASPHNIVANSELQPFISGIICGDDTEHSKPSRAMLDPLVGKGMKLENAIVIGDQFIDAQLAHNIGSRAILVAREGEEVPHLEKLRDGWESHVAIVNSLDEVIIGEHHGKHTD